MKGGIAERRFGLDPALAASGRPLWSLALSEILLQRDARWPWLILVPRRTGARELEDLSPRDRRVLLEEIIAAGAAVRVMGEAIGRPVTKLNVGALGNVTPQLHIHVVGRRPDDAAWPGPVWGCGTAVVYSRRMLARVVAAASAALGA